MELEPFRAKQYIFTRQAIPVIKNFTLHSAEEPDHNCQKNFVSKYKRKLPR